MDASRFDAWIRSLRAAASRRAVLGVTLAAALAPIDRDEAGARKKRKKCKACGPCKRCRKGRCKPKPDGTTCGTRKVCVGGSCRDVPPTCADEIKNGDETDVDCGGPCPQKCANGRDCLGDGDCQSGHCVGATCRECAAAAHCPDPGHPCRAAACTGGTCQVANVAGGGQTCTTGNVGVCAAGTTRCEDGELVCDQNVQPSAEICDGLDNDCDGVVDEGFDLQNDAENCGVCGRVCQFEHATARCAGGNCVVAACHPGFADCGGGGDCETQLGTATNCRFCGEVCNPDQACDPQDGCVCANPGGECDDVCCTALQTCAQQPAPTCVTGVGTCQAGSNVCALSGTPNCTSVAGVTQSCVCFESVGGESRCGDDTPLGGGCLDGCDSDAECQTRHADVPGAFCAKGPGCCIGGGNLCAAPCPDA